MSFINNPVDETWRPISDLDSSMIGEALIRKYHLNNNSVLVMFSEGIRTFFMFKASESRYIGYYNGIIDGPVENYPETAYRRSETTVKWFRWWQSLQGVSRVSGTYVHNLMDMLPELLEIDIQICAAAPPQKLSMVIPITRDTVPPIPTPLPYGEEETSPECKDVVLWKPNLELIASCMPLSTVKAQAAFHDALRAKYPAATIYECSSSQSDLCRSPFAAYVCGYYVGWTLVVNEEAPVMDMLTVFPLSSTMKSKFKKIKKGFEDSVIQQYMDTLPSIDDLELLSEYDVFMINFS